MTLFTRSIASLQTVFCLAVTGITFAQPDEAALEKKISEILAQMTVEEKVAMCSGDNAQFRGVSRLGIPNVICVDGPRGPNGGKQSTAFPTGVAFGATWNPELLEEIGVVMGNETRAEGAGMLLGPGINILRDTLGGRFFEYFTEDPLLNADLSTAIVKGIQSEGVAACIKHYAANNREDNRNYYMSMVDDRTLHEIYLPAFKASVQDGQAWAVMTSANGVNGDFVSDSKYLLNDVLKEKWGFDGFVLTDWLETRSTDKAAIAGLDVSMPGRNSMFGQPLLDAVKEGRIPEEVIDDKVRRILRIFGRIGVLDGRDLREGAARHKPEHQQVARKAAAESIVLLRNEGNFLPINPSQDKKILVVGPNANKRMCLGGYGGSSWVESPYEVTPLQGIRNVFGNNVTYFSTEHLGGFYPIPQDVMGEVDGTRGFKARFTGADGTQVEKVVPQLNFMWEMKGPAPEIAPDGFQAVFEGAIIPPQDGTYRLRMTVSGEASLFDVETHQRISAVNSAAGMITDTVAVQMKKDEPFRLRMTYKKLPGDAAIDLDWEPPTADRTAWSELKEAAQKADIVIFVGGIDHGVDTEGRDRASFDFPAIQQEMIHYLSEANKNLAVVLLNGSPLKLGGWLDNAKAVVEAWYPGMEGGNAIADVLSGTVNPSGRLPFTWPKELADTPTEKLASQTKDEVHYTEKLLVGYRYYDTKDVEPEFPFGFGLSYTDFDYDDLSAEVAGDDVKVTLRVKNTGKREGSEVVQVYVQPKNPSVARPKRELKSFQKVSLKPGEEKVVEVVLGSDAFSFYDPETSGWKKDPGTYRIEAGSSSRDLHQSTDISIP